MTRFQAGRLAVLLGPIFLLAACGSDVRHASRDLGNRLQTQLGTNITAGQAAVRPLPAGAQVTLTDPTVFPNGGAELDDRGRLVLASVVEGLLDPSLLQIQLADTSPSLANAALAAGPAQDNVQTARVRTVTQYLVEAGLGPSLPPPGTTPPAGMAPSAVGPTGLTFTIAVQCPDRSGPPGYGSGKTEPACR